ncbi:MAG: nicotinate-nucleotide adenylyltransferase [Nitrospirae bacterium]|nr:nicotinate-nucleotide adenylyltransferase [Nitrospirota bacterium]
MKIGVFGGTFNPIHYGHLRTAEEVREKLGLDKIIFIPTGKPPFKKPELAPARHRYEMIRTAIKDNPFFDVSDIEIKRRGVSYSVDTMQRLVEKHKDAEFFFIVGIDAFFDLPLWREPDKLISLTKLVVISRPTFSFADLSSSPYLKGVSKKILKELDRRDRSMFSFPVRKKALPSMCNKIYNEPSKGVYTGKKVFLCKITGLDISASHMRALIRSRNSIKYLLPDSVESYIISNELYKS